MTSPIGPELSQKIDYWRQKSREGTLSQKEMHEAIILLRDGRVSAQIASEGVKRKKSSTAPSADNMLKDLME